MSQTKKKTAGDAGNSKRKQGGAFQETVRRKNMRQPKQSWAWRHSAEITKAYQSGKSLRDLVPWVKTTLRIVVSHQTISEILKAGGVNLRSRGGQKKSQIWEYADEIAEKYKRGGTSTVKLAAKYGVSPGNIAAILKSKGIKALPFGKRKRSKAWKHESEIIREYFQDKIPQQKLAAKYSCSLTTLGKILRTVEKNK